jgi:hypothetical protein
LEAQRAEFVHEILNEIDENIVKQVMDYFHSRKEKIGKLPWQTTVDELRREVEQSEKDYENGLGITTEELLKKHPEWI